MELSKIWDTEDKRERQGRVGKGQKTILQYHGPEHMVEKHKIISLDDCIETTSIHHANANVIIEVDPGVL